MTVPTISTEQLIFLQPNFIEWHIITCLSDFCKKVRLFCSGVKVQNLIELLYILYFLYTDLLATKLDVVMHYYTKPSTAGDLCHTYRQCFHMTQNQIMICCVIQFACESARPFQIRKKAGCVKEGKYPKYIMHS